MPLRRGEPSTVEAFPIPQSLYPRPLPPQLETGSLPTPDSDYISLSQHYAQMAQDLRSSLPPACHWLIPEEVDVVGEHPIAAGGFADIYEGIHNGRKVVLKSFRCYLSFNVAEVVAVRHNYTLCRVCR